ncbi:MAG: response regulator transcription factor [Flavobacteriales bacterium]|nr:response regulator transcription factor [Flavobacteriales bacterium]
MRILIADDDPLSAGLLQHHLGKVAPTAQLTHVTDGLAAQEMLRSSSFDLLFLDLQMPGMDGRELLALGGVLPPVIIVTGDPDFALGAYAYDVVDYLVKPVTFERFALAWRKAAERKAAAPARVPGSVFVRAGSDIVRIALGEVRYVKSESNYVRFVLDGREVTSLMNMKDLERKLPPTFVRVHRSYFVNLRHVEKLDAQDVKIGRDLIPVSDTYRPELLKRLDLL